MSSEEQLIARPESHGHVLQLYGADRRALTTNVSRYLLEGLRQGEHLIVIARAGHRRAFLKQLKLEGADPDQAQEVGQLVLIDAEEALAGFMVDGQPDPALFDATIGKTVRSLRRASHGSHVRAYGDMVGILWDGRQLSAAVRLEELWNQLLAAVGFRLFCACPVDVFGGDFRVDVIDDLLCAHTELMSSDLNGDLEYALRLAMNEASSRRRGISFPAANRNGNGAPHSRALPDAEAWILSLRRNAPEHADQVLARAREHYEAEKRFRALIDNSSDAICLTNPHGSIIYASGSNERVLGYPPGELLGRNVIEFIHPDDVDLVRQNTKRVRAAGRAPVRVETRIQRKDGTWCWVESTTSNLLDEPNVRAIVSNYRDISDRKAAQEQTLRDAEHLARYAAELEAFAYAAAHDLKEPLRTIKAFTELLIQRTNADADARQVAGFVVDGVNRMSVLLDDLLSFTTVSFSDPPRPVVLQDALQQAISNLEKAISESGAKIEADGLPVVKGSATHLVQILQNLIGNSIKYRGDAHLQIHVSAERCGGEWTVRVRDNGIGIAAEYQDRVFGLFKRLHSRDIPGTGIGLAICRKLVEGGGGRIWVESEPGMGATFCFTAPAC